MNRNYLERIVFKILLRVLKLLEEYARYEKSKIYNASEKSYIDAYEGYTVSKV